MLLFEVLSKVFQTIHLDRHLRPKKHVLRNVKALYSGYLIQVFRTKNRDQKIILSHYGWNLKSCLEIMIFFHSEVILRLV